MSDASFNTATSRTGEAGFGDYFALLKPRVMTLVVFTALVGLLAAPVGVHPVVGFAAILFIAVGGGASGALNMWWDADIDRVMKRTRSRPIPAGTITEDEAFAFGIALAGFAVVMLALATNLVAAALLAFTIFFYVVIYSMWLKRWTPQNIVIGGAAGAFPPMIGWAAATGDGQRGIGADVRADLHVDAAAFLGAGAVHASDYEEAGVPMLTVTHGRRATRRHILVYTILLAPLAVGTASPPWAGRFTGGGAGAERAVPGGRAAHLAPRRGHGRGRWLRGRKAVLPPVALLSVPAFRGDLRWKRRWCRTGWGAGSG